MVIEGTCSTLGQWEWWGYQVSVAFSRMASNKRKAPAARTAHVPDAPTCPLTHPAACICPKQNQQPALAERPHHKQPAHLSASRFMRDAITSIWPSWLKARLSIVVVRLSTDLSGLPASAVQNAAVGQAARHPRADR